MRQAFQVVATVFLASLVLGAMLMAKINFGWVTKIDAMRGDLVTRFFVEGARSDIPPSAEFERAAWIWIVLGIATLLGMVAVFLKKRLFAIGTALGLVVFASVTVLIQPSMTNINGNNPQTTGMGIAFFGILGMCIVILLHTTMRQDQGESQSRSKLF